MGNFQRVSFNIGPTLFEWMIEKDPHTCQLIRSQDQANVRAFGVGNAIAQPYHHTILPLATERDKRTQVIWGIEQFEYRFGRKPLGMWLPETAMDLATLCALADQGIQFTLLAPWQAETDHLDVTEPYRVTLPGDREITIFFYHSELSGGISFNPSMTVDADRFARNDITPRFHPLKVQRGEAQLLLVASDGELYGHHQPLRDYFLAHLINGGARAAGITPTFPALWLKEHSPRKTVRLREQTSWSCHHGISRWTGSCGCLPGDHSWKKCLREAFNRLSKQIDEVYFGALQAIFREPWVLRDRYIRFLLGAQPLQDLVSEQAGKQISEETCLQVKLLLDAQLQCQRMYASCAWFFEDFDRIEPRNSVAYAAQAVRLVRKATGVDLSPQLMSDLRCVVSTRSGVRGDQVLADHLKRAGSFE
jgi:hypothetical protein